MSCPTCDHTLFGIGHGTFHCPRCGTLVGDHFGGGAFVPLLVDRCRLFAGLPSVMDDAAWHDWRRLGIDESIAPPEARKTS